MKTLKKHLGYLLPLALVAGAVLAILAEFSYPL